MNFTKMMKRRGELQRKRILKKKADEFIPDEKLNSNVGKFIKAIRQNKTCGSDLSSIYTRKEIIEKIRNSLKDGVKDTQCFICRRTINPAYKLIPDKKVQSQQIIKKATFCKKHRKIVSDVFGYKVAY